MSVSAALRGKQNVTIEYFFNTGLSSLSSLTITVEEHPTVAPQRQRIRVWNFTTSEYDQVDDRNMTTTSDQTTVINVSNPAPYISGTGQVQLYVRTGDLGSTTYTLNVDLVKITASS